MWRHGPQTAGEPMIQGDLFRDEGIAKAAQSAEGKSPGWGESALAMHEDGECVSYRKVKKMKILVACEFSGTVRDAFVAKGHDAMSCDLLDTEKPGPHYKGNVFDILGDGWDMMIAHPPCTHLAVSGARWFKHKQKEQQEALEFVGKLLDAPITKIALENPISIISTYFRRPDQIIQPWQFGHGETKATCLWLKNLPKLKPTNIVEGREQRIWKMPPSYDRWKERSRTFQGIADAMAEQWSCSIK